jgi:O-antigen ligase
VTAALSFVDVGRFVARRRTALDGASLITVYLVLLIAIPSRFGFAPLGGAGGPALIFGVACLVVWLVRRVHTAPRFASSAQPIRILAGLFVAAVVASYVAACMRPINAPELNLATLALIGVSGWMGVLLLAHDEVAEPARLLSLVNRLALAGTLFAALGLFQFATHEVWIDRISIPGLSLNNGLYGTQFREGFTRPSGTALHAIEFGVVLTMLLPLTLARAVLPAHITHARSALNRWLPPSIIVVAIALSSSRSAWIGAAAGILVLFWRLPARIRALAPLAAVVLGAAVFVLVPGMLGSVLGLFTGIGTDTSAQSRTASYPIAAAYIAHSPVLGRGLSTFTPGYRIFDNQYLLCVVEIGVLGTLLLVVMLAGAVLVGHLAGERAPEDGGLGLVAQGLAGAVAAGAVSLALFDAFSFPMVPGLLFLFVGLLGATRRAIHSGLDVR